MNCKKCGKEVFNSSPLCDECNNANKNQIMRYISIALAVLCSIMPFLKWIDIPVAKGLYSMFGMEKEMPSFSLFGYIFAGNRYQTDGIYWITMILAVIAFVGIIFNVIYIIKSLKNNPKCCKYGTIASIILTSMSGLFIIIVGLSALILKVITLTIVPYLTLAVAVANIIIIKKIGKVK